MADSFEIKMPKFETSINVNVSGEAELRKLYDQLSATQDELDRAKSKAQSLSEALEGLRGEYDSFAHSNGIDILQEELERFKSTAEQSVDEFRAFLQSVNLNDAWGNNDWQFDELFERIKDGSMTASQAILRVKTDCRALMEESYQASGGLFDSQMVQEFTASLDHLGETIGTVVERLNSIEQNGVKAIGGSGGGGDVTNVLQQIETAARGMSEEVKGSYESITSLVSAMNEYANLDSTKLLGVSQAFRNIADIGKGSYGTKSIENIVYLAKQLQGLSSSGAAIRFDFTGFNDLKVSKASVSNLATYLPQIASVNVSKLEKLSQVNLTNFNNVKVSKSAIENISRLTEAIQVLKEVKAASVKADESSINITGGEREKQDTSHYKDATRAVKEYYAMLTQLGKAKSDVTLTSEGWKSESGQWDELAAALNRTKTAFDLYTSSENQSKLTAEEKVNLLRLLTTESERYVLSIEAQANKEQEAAEKAARKAEEKAERERAAAEKAASSKEAAAQRAAEKEEAAAQKAAAAAEAAEARKQEAAKMSDAQIENNLLKIEKLQTSINGAITNADALGIDSEELARLRELSAELETLKTNTQNGSVTNKDFADSLTKIRLSADIAGAAVKRDADEMEERLIPGTTEFGAAQQELARKTTQAQNALRGFTAAEKSTKETSRAAYSTIKNQVERYKELEARLSSGEMTQEEFANAVKKSSGIVAENIRIIKENGDAHETTGEKIKGAIAKFSQWFSVTRVVMAAYRTMKKMVSAVIEVDTAMTELRKVTDETENTYDRFLENSTKRAKALGATLTDTINATADFARLGYTLEESSQLADAAIVYKNVGDGIEDIGEASESVISTMKAFGVEASDAMLIVDKFNEVGNNFAISSKGVGDALVRSASAMHAANNTLDETIALITTANTVVQNPDSVGTAMKTLSMYLRAAKTEAEEAGESTEGMANSVSELRGEILALTGGKVDIQIDEDSFKSTYQIIKELSEVWGELTDISQANILEMIGGKRNSNVVSALIENFQLAEDVMKSSANAAGSATAENEKYLESIQGHIDVLKASFETFSTDLLNSDLIKFIVDAGTGIINLLDSATRLHLLLPAILATITLIKGTGMAKMAMESASKVATLSASLIAEKTATDSLAASVSALSVKQKQRVATNILNAVASGKLTEAEGVQILATLGLAAADGTLTVANKGLATSFKSVMASIPVFGWIALAISLVVEAITVLTSFIDTTSDSIADLDTELDSLTNTAKTAANEFTNLKSNADEIIPRFAELCKGVDEFGNRLTDTNGKMILTDEEYEEFWELNNKIAEMFPDLDVGIDSNGNHILSLSYSVDTLTESLEALVEAERQAANQKIIENLDDTLENIEKAEKAYKKETTMITGKSNHLTSAYNTVKSYGDAGFSWNTSDRSDRNTDRYKAQAYKDALDALGIKYTVAQSGYNPTTRVYDIENIIPDDADWDRILREYEDDLSGFSKEVEDTNAKAAARWKKLNPIMGAWLQTTDSYAIATDEIQNLLSKVIGNINYGDIGITDGDDLKEYLQDNVIDTLIDATPDVQDAVKRLFLNDGELSINEFESLANKIKEQFGEDNPVYLYVETKLNGDGKGDNGIVGMANAVKSFIKDEFDSSVDELSLDDLAIAASDDFWKFLDVLDGTLLSLDELNQKLKEFKEVNNQQTYTLTDLSDALQKLKSKYDIVATAEKEMVDGGLTPSTIKSLADEEEHYLDYLYEENGIVKLNVEAWKERANLEMENSIKAIESELEALDAERLALENAKVYADDYTGAIEEGAYKQSEHTAAVEANSAAIAENQAKLGLYTTLYGSVSSSLDAYTTALSNFSNISSVISSVSDSLTTVADLQETVANGFTLSLEKALEFAAVYPEILNGATVAADGQIALNEGIVNAFIEGKEAELHAQIDAEIAKLESDKAVLTAKKDFAQAELDLAKNVGDGEGQISQELAEYRVNAGNAVAQALIESGIDEATAYQLAMAAMAQNSEEFNRIAAQVCTDVDGNFNQAAYSAAQGIYNNMKNASSSLDGIIRAAHNAASAIAGISRGVQTGSTGSFSGAGGSSSGGAKITLTNGKFQGVDYSYTPQTVSLNKFISDLELDISSYSKAIAQIDGQIATLKALRDTSLNKFSTGYKNASSGGGSGGSGGGGGSSSNEEETWFEKQYKLHQHFLDMDAESFADYLKWLDSAYQEAYDEGIIDLDNFYKYQEEVYKGLQDIFAAAKDAFDELVDYRIDMLKKDIENEKDALDKKLDNLKEFYDRQKEMLQEAADEEKYLDEQSEKRKSVTDIQSQLAQLEYDNSAWAEKRKVELRQELADVQKELDDFEKDHALELALSAIDDAYNSQEAQIQAEMDALDERLNDPSALYNQALTDIKNNTEALYNEMISYNRKNGDSKDETIKEMWENAYKSNEDLKTITGLGYNGIDIVNATGYKPPVIELPASDTEVSVDSVQEKQEEQKEQVSKKSYPYGKVSDVAGNIKSGSSGTAVKALQYALNQLGYGNAGTRSLDGIFGSGTASAVKAFQKAKGLTADGIVGAKTKAKFSAMGYASGTNKAIAGLHAIDELGTETIFESADGTRYKMFSGGEKVLNARASDFLYEFANGGGEILGKIIKAALGGGTFDKIMPVVNNNEINMGDIIIQGSATENTVSEIRRAERDNLKNMLQSLNKLNK